jgi:crotonobetainyl-CoA:carnitine CoA-transferase CaiB-like acyl-CoA transferase
VVDLSALWAGPYCGSLLAEAGYDVCKIEDPRRPDPTAATMPALDARLNGQKTRANSALNDPRLFERIAAARVLITSARPHALARAGLDEARIFAANPGLLWMAITAHGWTGSNAMRVGFGDDCAAAGGLVRWVKDAPEFVGDALADPLTGLIAATWALEALGRSEAGLIDAPLSGVSSCFATGIWA